jgi:hypothetical protein
MSRLDKTCWCLLGAICLPNFVVILFLASYRLIGIDLGLVDLRTWFWLSYVLGLAAGIGCLWRLPFHWFLRADIVILYVIIKGLFLLEGGDRLAAGLFA